MLLASKLSILKYNYNYRYLNLLTSNRTFILLAPTYTSIDNS